MTATTQFTDRPDPARADAAIAKVSTWDVGTPERQRQAVDAVRTAWEGRDTRNADIDAAVPGIERLALHTYELYRSGFRAGGDTREPGCVVIVDVEFDGPDPDRQRAWIDAVFEALGGEARPPEGAIAAYFHTGTDGTRVLNYAEWESAAHHIAALAAPGDGIGSPSPLWERVQTYPRMTGGGVHRYTPALSMRAG
ncbi:antibiotic biosynthesis monooxygenase [Streptomyces sp. WAC04770]|nr:antibiotic biosynthesis monooxygenase [Streptomyces sp. WAC04770]RST21780.1 antibiotic biosynthesis monooxygenase [Streptomyces sp. WAC04770]